MIVTGVGSLPHTSAIAAADFVADTAGLAYLPQLPGRHPAEGMIAQWGDALCGHVGGEHDAAEAFRGAAEVLKRLGPGPEPVKTQATGPVTLAVALVHRGHDADSVWDCVVPALTQRIRRHLTDIEAAAPETTPVVMLDEPSLVAFGPAAAVPPEIRARATKALRTVVSAIDAPVGVHCCADTDWGIVTDSGASVISWDVLELATGFQEHLEDIALAIAEGTTISWGLVPVTGSALPAAEDLAGRYRTALAELVVRGAPLPPMREGAWLTPACGLAGLTVEQAERVMDRVNEVGVMLDGG